MKYNGNYRRREKEKHILGEDVLYEEKTLRRHNRISALRIFIIFLGLAIAFMLLFFAAKALFKVETISVEGAEQYRAEQIAEDCGISLGEFMFSFPASRIKEHILLNFPFVESVKVERIYPSSLIITVSEYKNSYVCCQFDKYVLFGEDLKVLEVADSNIWGEDMIIMELPRVQRALIGRPLEFADDVRTDYIVGIIDALEAVKIEQSIDKITLTDYFNIKMSCEERIFISLGKYNEKEIKLKMQTLNEIMKSERVVNAAAVSIDITELKQQSIIPYDRVEDMK